MTLREILDMGTKYLHDSGIDEAQLQARQLLEFVFEINRSYYFVHSDDIIEGEKSEQYQALLKRRAMREPLQYITQEAYFMGHRFFVNGDVLIPRFDTEILVAKVSEIIKAGDSILDMCTGSGCIAIALALEHSNVQVEAVDISDKALAVARRNAKDLKAEVVFKESDLFEKVMKQYDIIVSNPPYIRSAVIEELMEEVQGHEPWLALDGDEDGLKFYRQIVAKAKDFLRKEGFLAFEIGHNQGDEVSAIMTEANYYHIRVIKDLAGLDRVVIGQR